MNQQQPPEVIQTGPGSSIDVPVGGEIPEKVVGTVLWFHIDAERVALL